ncbi:MAG: LamG-like jellyroll fold domain-containing protein, partial [Pseudomonadota bacterium]
MFEPEPGICPFTKKPLVPVHRASAKGGSLEFGPNSLGDCGTSSLLDLSQGFTLEGWYYLGNSSKTFCLIEITKSWANTLRICNDKASDALIFFDQKNNNTVKIDGVFKENIHHWLHLAVSVDASGKCKVFVNGIEKGTGTNIFRGKGADFDGIVMGGGETTDQRGRLSEVRIWNQARSQQEIRAYMALRARGDETGLLACWPLDEGSGAVARDIARYHLNSKLRNPVWVPETPMLGYRNWGVKHFFFNASDGNAKVTGLSSQLYFQQEDAQSGHSPVKKPLKRSARTMLAIGQDSGEPVLLDFPVRRDGKLVPLEGNYDVSSHKLDPTQAKGGVCEMPVLKVDQQGLAVRGGYVPGHKVAWITERLFKTYKPNLFESADGQITLYGHQSALFLEHPLSYYSSLAAMRFNTKTGKASYELTTTYDVHVGDLTSDLSGTNLQLKSALPFALPTTAVLRIGTEDVSPAAAVSQGDKQIVLNASVTANQGDPVYLVDAPGLLNAALAQPGTVHFVARNAGGAYNHMAITVAETSDKNERYCDITIQPKINSGAGLPAGNGTWLKEYWPRIPRQVNHISNIFNGLAPTHKLKAGTVEYDDQHPNQLLLHLTQKLYRGALVEVGISQIAIPHDPRNGKVNIPASDIVMAPADTEVTL